MILQYKLQLQVRYSPLQDPSLTNPHKYTSIETQSHPRGRLHRPQEQMHLSKVLNGINLPAIPMSPIVYRQLRHIHLKQLRHTHEYIHLRRRYNFILRSCISKTLTFDKEYRTVSVDDTPSVVPTI